jgi:hypothetical protein
VSKKESTLLLNYRKEEENMDIEKSVLEQGRKIFLTNEFEKIKQHYKKLKDITIKLDPSDENYIEYLESDFNRAIENFIKKDIMNEN